MFTHPQKKGGRKERRKESRMRDNRRALFTIYINMLTVSSDVSIQRRHWQPLLWGYCAHPTHDVNDVWGWPRHQGLHALLFSNSGLGFWTDKCKCCEMGPTVFILIQEDPECWSSCDSNPRPLSQQTGTLPTELTKWWFYPYPHHLVLCRGVGTI